jgi:hypothetical protein
VILAEAVFAIRHPVHPQGMEICPAVLIENKSAFIHVIFPVEITGTAGISLFAHLIAGCDDSFTGHDKRIAAHTAEAGTQCICPCS